MLRYYRIPFQRPLWWQNYFLTFQVMFHSLQVAQIALSISWKCILQKKINRLYSSMELFFLSTVKLSSQVGRFQETEYWKFEDGCKFCLARYNKLGGQFWVEGVLTPASIILLRNFWLALLTQITQRSARWMCEASTRARDNWDEIRRTHMVLVIRVVELWIASNRCLSAPRMNLLSNPKVDRYVTLIRSPTK